jgi:hypothetical protein
MAGCRSLRQVGPSDDNVREMANLKGAIEMISYHIRAVLASERRKTLIAEAEAAHWARQARRHRQLTGMSAARRSPHRRLVGWLWSDRSRRHFQPLFQPVLEDDPEAERLRVCHLDPSCQITEANSRSRGTEVDEDAAIAAHRGSA